MLYCVLSARFFEKCVYKNIHNFIVEHNLLSRHQSGFRQGDSTINQLLYTLHEFSNALDAGKEVTTVFFHISKAFDRVWHKGLLYKIEQMGICGDLLRSFRETGHLSHAVGSFVVNLILRSNPLSNKRRIEYPPLASIGIRWTYSSNPDPHGIGNTIQTN